ncbi:A24 family peptidase [Allobranchiibius sp. CTAmp26]|uniref:prepilin peptidase n=1 Tax=Allobranchiibius sp. CTAmp26 TaxID=2815214 RepID=UPI001AA16E71|nr:A24 family peptidase [Allobranchiibius sp. CTAmp26]MBO1755499.1 prepilin peptidase [Allobranchiibius sp. CTAmp26]
MSGLSLVTWSSTAVVFVFVVGVAVGAVLRAWLRPGAYRLPTERDLPARRTWWIIPATGAVGALLWAAVSPHQPVLISAVFVIAGWVMIVLGFIDLDVHRLPDAIQLPSYPILLLLLAVGATTGGNWGAFTRAIVAAVVLFIFYFVLLLLPSGYGFGDVKLAGLLGMLLGWLGWSPVIHAAFAAFLIGGLVAAALMLTRQKDRRAEFAYGPSMLAGAVLAIAWSALSS